MSPEILLRISYLLMRTLHTFLHQHLQFSNFYTYIRMKWVSQLLPLSRHFLIPFNIKEKKKKIRLFHFRRDEMKASISVIAAAKTQLSLAVRPVELPSRKRAGMLTLCYPGSLQLLWRCILIYPPVCLLALVFDERTWTKYIIY